MRLKLKNIEIGHEQIKVFHKAQLVSCLIVFHNRTIAKKSAPEWADLILQIDYLDQYQSDNVPFSMYLICKAVVLSPLAGSPNRSAV